LSVQIKQDYLKARAAEAVEFDTYEDMVYWPF